MCPHSKGMGSLRYVWSIRSRETRGQRLGKMVSCDEAGIRLDASGEGRGMEKGKKASLMHNIRGIMHAYPEREEMILKGHVIS